MAGRHRAPLPVLTEQLGHGAEGPRAVGAAAPRLAAGGGGHRAAPSPPATR